MILNILPFSTLHRHVLKEILRIFLICSTFLLVIVLMGRGLNIRDELGALNLTLPELITIFGFMAPTFLLLVIPLSCMLSIFLAFLRMSTDRELVALKAGGVSVAQLLPAPIWFSLFCFILTLYMSLFGVAWGMDNFRSTVMHIARTRAELKVQPGVFNQDVQGMTLFARQVDPKSGLLKEVIFEDSTRDKDSRITVLAPTGTISTDTEKGELVFELHDGKIYKLDKKNVSVLSFGAYNIRIALDSLFEGVQIAEVTPKTMAWGDLLKTRNNYREAADLTKEETNQLRSVMAEIQKRWSLPVSCLVLGLFALPLATIFEGARQQIGVVLALVTFLIYYAVYSIGITLSEAGSISPVIGLWAPNVLFLIMGIAGIIVSSKEGAPDISALLRAIPRPKFMRRTKAS